MPNQATFGEVLQEYRTLSQALASGGKSAEYTQVGRAIQKLLKAELDRMPLPQGLRAEYTKLSNLTKMGGQCLTMAYLNVLHKQILVRKKVLDQILVKGKNDVAEDFFKKN